MDLSDIVSIAGKPGLFKVVARSEKMLVVESIVDGKRIPAYSTYKVSALDDIAIYTETDTIPLVDVFKKIFKKEAGKSAIDSSSSADELKKYVTSIIPEYDKERVYVSDLKNLIKWYNLLLEKGMLKEEKKKVAPAEKKEAKSKTERPKGTGKKVASKPAIEKKAKKPAAKKAAK